ncbi:MAG TPA: isochorismatase family cysteine hydrolase [Candidatus Limnocylindrales bacterium]
MDWDLVPERTALINVDLQNCFVESLEDPRPLLDRINALSAACRVAGILVIHTRHVVRPDGSNLGVLREVERIRNGLLNDGAPSAELHSDLVLDPLDLRLDKPRFGAFHGTDLELTLRTRGIDTVIVSGISTIVCCDTTAREAHARDFRVFFLRDGTATAAGPEFQNLTLDVLDGLFAQVLSVDEMLAKITASTTPTQILEA